MNLSDSEYLNFDYEEDFDQFLKSVLTGFASTLSVEEQQQVRETLSRAEFGYVADYRNARLLSAILDALPKKLRRTQSEAIDILAKELREPMISAATEMGIELDLVLASTRSTEALTKGLSQEIIRSQNDAIAMAILGFPKWKVTGSPLVDIDVTLQSKSVSAIVDYAYPYNRSWMYGGMSDANGVASMRLKPQTYIFRGKYNGRKTKKVDATKVPVFHGMNSTIGVAF